MLTRACATLTRRASEASARASSASARATRRDGPTRALTRRGRRASGTRARERWDSRDGDDVGGRARGRRWSGTRASARERTEPGAVDVWCHDAAASDAGRDAEDEVARGIVTAREWEELRGNRTRLVARAFARRTLARYDGNGTRGRDVTLATGARGKPRVEAPEGLRGLEFSVSHCDGLTAVVVSASGACGIDVEDENRRIGTDVGAFARRWLSEREAARLDRIEDVDERARAFMRLWTVKEAYVKALGLGIAGRPFREFDVAWDEAAPASDAWTVNLRDDARDDAERWRLTLLRPRASHPHVMSLCVPATASGDAPRVRARWASLLDDDASVVDVDDSFTILGASRHRT